MTISFQDVHQKAQFITGDTTSATLTQLKQDINTGYQRFNADMSRYFSRKQKFANVVAGQKFYQTPVDSVSVEEVSVLSSASGPEYPLVQVRSEDDWRRLNIFPYNSNIISHYYVYGNDQIGLFPTPSASITNAIRYVYSPQDVNLTQDDYLTGTATVSNTGTAVTGSGTTWTTSMIGRQFQITDGSDGNWYEITAVGSATTLTIKTPYNGPSVTNVVYRISQCFILPGEYDDVPVDWALTRFYEFRNNPGRAAYHAARYKDAVDDALRKYASSSTSQVITDDDNINIGPANPWEWTPTPG